MEASQPGAATLAPRDLLELRRRTAELAALNQRLHEELSRRQLVEKTFRALIEYAPDATIIANAEGTITLLNARAEQMFGYAREELVGRPIETLTPERFRGRHVSHRAGYLHDPKARPMGIGLEVLGRRKDGSEFPVEISLNPVQTHEGLRIATTIADITQRRQLAEQAKQAAILEERNRFAREVHDTLAQGLAGIVVQLQGAQDILDEDPDEAKAQIIRATNLARANLEEARRSVMSLHPRLLPKEDLPRSIAHLTGQLASQMPVQVDFSVLGAPRPLPSEIEENLFRIGQEALNNVWKHSRATRVRVELCYVEGSVRLCVQDNGIGFVNHPPDSRSAFGLAIMRERAERIGATLDYQTRPNDSPEEGTRMEVTVPVASGHGGGS